MFSTSRNCVFPHSIIPPLTLYLMYNFTPHSERNFHTTPSPEQNFNISAAITPSPEQNFNISAATTPSPEQNFSVGAAIAISVTVVIVLLAVMIISGILLYFCFKKKKVKDIDMTQ